MNDPYSWEIIKQLMAFPDAVTRSFEQKEPSVLAKYAIGLAQDFNKYYSQVKVLEDDEQKEGRLALVFAVTILLKEALRLLGVHAPVEM